MQKRNEEKHVAELLVVSDEKADSDRGRKKKVAGHLEQPLVVDQWLLFHEGYEGDMKEI